ncbi:MAG TPA: hypothetical protein DG414_07375 [Gammaproteobacteria bacterium]|mgnify:CR=1 FL=1|jgi:predicted ribosomally synthesized peptide with nif11-like leader|nr:hypothetical protein [Gammaproteobacteria bacterium]|tara:strand:+ start:486 stop:830 length:345 start_codon:yes stop_codon:yes gene_type:complete
MSKENLEQFMNQVAGSEELQARIGEEINAEALIALGAECGCEFTAEELQESAELSDEEFDAVAGGRSRRMRIFRARRIFPSDVGPAGARVPRSTRKMGYTAALGGGDIGCPEPE